MRGPRREGQTKEQKRGSNTATYMTWGALCPQLWKEPGPEAGWPGLWGGEQRYARDGGIKNTPGTLLFHVIFKIKAPGHLGGSVG